VVALKVVHISTSDLGGAGRAAYRIHEALLKNSVDSSFLTIGSGGNEDLKNVFVQTVTSDIFIKEPGFVLRQKNRIRFRIRKHLGIEIKFLEDQREKVIEEFRNIKTKLDCEIATLPFASFNILENQLVREADIIHLHWVANMIDYQRFFTKNKIPVVWTLHDMHAFQGLFHYKEDEIRNKEFAKGLDKKIYGIKRKAINKRRSELAIVSPSKWLLREASNSRALRNVTSSYIPYPIDTTTFFREQDIDFKEKNNIPAENSVFLFVVESVKINRKGFDLLKEALKKMKLRSFTLFVLGNSDNLQMEGFDIRIIGTVKDNNALRKYYSSVDAFIIPSREDNLPNVMIESLACGTPVIGFPVGGIKEHVIDFKTGLLTKNLNADSLAKTIEKFCKHKEQFKSEAIQNYVKEKFDEDHVAQEYIKVYSKLLKTKRLA
jgi:glycosyltransferase involved in cell wall biosynthesis